MAQETRSDAERRAVLAPVLAPGGTLDLHRLRRFVPQEWAGRTSVGLDGVIRVDLSRADAEAALPSPVREQLVALAPALAGQQLAGEDAVEALEAGHRLSALLEDARVHAARELAARTADKALQVKGVTSPEELSKTAFDRWRARSKSVTAAEIQALTGMGRGAARELVAIATAPDVCGRPVRQGLAAGIARWDLVLAWWRRCARLPHEASAVVARALFATDVPTDEVASERITPEGHLSTQPWAKKQFFDALEREAKLQEGADTAAQEKRREAQHAARDAYGIVDDDGTAQLVIRGDVGSVTGCLERLQSLARKARDEGDPRTVPQLRSDVARALLLHGSLPLPALGQDPNFITPEDIQRLVDVLAGAPAHELQVIVPWDVLTGRAALVNHYPAEDVGAELPSDPVSDRTKPRPPPGDATPTPRPGDTLREATPAMRPAHSPLGDPQCHTGDRASADEDVGIVEGVGVLGGVGRVLGRFSRFMSAAEVRRIAGRPGTTIYRLLMDPADGRCIERSVARYAPDAAMRAQLHVADVMSRAPGSTVPARHSDLDHVEEYLLGGRTSETNLQALDRPWHALKTERFWDAVMDSSRNVTWESFWGRLYGTRPHDYRQYLSGRRPPVGRPAPSTADAQLTPVEQRHLASLLVYAALAHRAPGERLEAIDDDPDSDEEILGVREAIWIRHTTSNGRRRSGPRPGTPTPEQLITHDPYAVLNHPDWTTLGGVSAARDTNADGDGSPSEPAPPPPF